MNLIFVGAAAIARSDVRKARDPTVRMQHEREYRADLERCGGELTLSEANRRLTVDGKEIEEFLRAQTVSGDRGTEARRMILDPRWDHDNPTTKRLYQRNLIEDTRVTDYFEFGEAAQLLYGERLPTTRLWIHWKDYVVGCVPDDVGDYYVYEFRASTRTGRDLEVVQEQAVKQAKLYAYAFKRPRIKVQIANLQISSRNPFPLKAKDLPKPDIVTVFEHSTDQNALAILSEFDRAFRGVV